MDNTIEEIKKIILDSDNIVFFGGAGLSTESGIPDFRSVDGLYNQEYDYPPETIISASFFKKNPKEFYRFYKNKCLKPMLPAMPNAAHKGLAKLEKMGKLKAIVTQNIDDLHHKAGSKVIYELHGTSYRNYCVDCHKKYTVEDILNDKNDIPKCECGGIIRPDIVLYEEGLDNNVITKSIQAISSADVLIVAGTSLVVYPAAGLINYYNGDKLILINLSSVSQEAMANYVIHEKVGKVFEEIMKGEI
ncbi:MAG: NAD-dependent protein deacylase [Lachnospiraceae bacterium]|nr:NAD-dependent protein deacylase [Lachnospiraceae bacterium]